MMTAVKSIVLTSNDPARTAAFYRDVLLLPLEEEQHRGTDRHWAGQLGEIHIAIHPREGFWLPTSEAPGSQIVSFTVPEIEPLLAHLAQKGVAVTAQRKIGPMSFISVTDPDGRHVCCGTPWPGAKR